MELYDAFQDRRDDFEIVAFHDNKATDLADYDRKIAGVKAQVWGGRDLPFPVLLDKTGQTLRTYGISSFPTIILVDPEGKIVRGGGEHTVRQHLLGTSSAVKRYLKKLKAAKGEAFPAAVKAVAKAGDEYAGFALATFADQAAPDQVPAIADALEKMEGPHAIGFFLGKHGAKAADKKARIRAAGVLGEICPRNMIGALVPILNQEQDPDVKEALVAALNKLNSK